MSQTSKDQKGKNLDLSAVKSQNKKSKDKKNEKPKRPPIPPETKLRLWIEAGGRCEFPGCNRYLYHDKITLAPGNFANIAHIVAWTKTGPRGEEIESPLLATNISNLMLMCKDHADKIDKKENWDKYNKFVLREYKKQHEERIHTLTSIHEEAYRTKPLVFSFNIGDRLTTISTEAVFNAMLPKFSTKLIPDSLVVNDFNRNAGQEYWEAYKERIKYFVETVKGKYSGNSLEKHISIFAIGPMPLLMYLGKCIGDVPGYDVYQSFRSAPEEKLRWTWPNDASTEMEEYQITYANENEKSKKVALVLEISDNIHQVHLNSVVDDSWAVYRIQANNPSVFSIKSKEQLITFAYEYRKVLDHVKSVHGPDSEINIFPALPVSLAVQCGLSILPTKDPTIYVYELYKEETVFKKILKLQ